MSGLWNTLWPGWDGFAREVFNGLITLPIFLPAQQALVWLWSRAKIRREIERHTAALHARIDAWEERGREGEHP